MQKGLMKLDERKVLNKISRFLNKEVKSRNAKCDVIGISGGIDSTVTAYISAQSLGSDKVLGLLLPDYSVTPKVDVKHGLEISKNLNINYELIDIGKGKNKIIKNFPRNKLAKANFLVRLRMAILYYYAAAKGGIVVGTADISELQLGYFTNMEMEEQIYFQLQTCIKQKLGKLQGTWRFLRILLKNTAVQGCGRDRPPKVKSECHMKLLTKFLIR
ncbi:MAG: NAD(+) synthase [Nitrosopumilus sp.]|nr:NAD(+) synthase [Nitrosopumilus sp.]